MNRICFHEGHPTLGKRGSTAHQNMIHSTNDEPAPSCSSPKFPLGRVLATPGAIAAIPQDEITAAIRRHSCGDWGDLDEHDRSENERSLREGGRIFSAYHSKGSEKFYIITEADRSATTVLLPDEY